MKELVKNLKTGKTGTVIRRDGDRIHVAFGNLRIWGKASNYMPVKILKVKKYTELVSANITCPFCRETIMETSDIARRSVCACNIGSFSADIQTAFISGSQSGFIADIKNRNVSFRDIGERYRHIAESSYSDKPDWKEINKEIVRRFGKYHLRIIQEYIASGDMPYLDPDELAIRIACAEAGTEKTDETLRLRTFPKMEIAGVYILNTSGVTWNRQKEKYLWEYRSGESEKPGFPVPGPKAESKPYLSGAISA